jgi:hypothetical protein
MDKIIIEIDQSTMTIEDWSHISSISGLSEDFIREHKNKLDWAVLSCNKGLPEDLIREFQDKVDWTEISHNQRLSEDFIREFKDKVDWNYISIYQILSEDFIREFKDKVYWEYISIYQTLSEDFIREFKDKINFSRPNIIFERDIEPFHPCVSGAKRYLKIWDKDQEITWNELIEKYDDKDDIEWLADKLK